MTYQYLAYNESGEVVKGKLTAPSEDVAANLLSYAGYQTINLKPFVPFLSLDRLMGRLSRVRPSEIILFYRKLALLIGSGINIVSALELLQGQAPNRTLRKVWAEVIADLRGGNQLSSALSKHPDIFSPVYCRLLGIGEQSGDLESILRQVADYMEKDIDANKKIKDALLYPVITSVITVVVIGVLVTVVLPAFGTLYSALGVQMPLPAKIMLAISAKLRSYGVLLLLMGVVGLGVLQAYLKTTPGKYKWDKLILTLPLVGPINHLNELSRYMRSMSILISSGLPLTEVMLLVVRGSGNTVMAKAFSDVQADMVKGEGLSRPMAKHDVFLPMVTQMVKIGEESGNLDTILLAVAQSCETEAADRSRALIALIQPMMTIIIGLVIGFIALTLSSAMYSIYGQGF